MPRFRIKWIIALSVMALGVFMVSRYQLLHESISVQAQGADWIAYDTNDDVTLLRRTNGELLVVRWDTRIVTVPGNNGFDVGPWYVWRRDRTSFHGVAIDNAEKWDPRSHYRFTGETVKIHCWSRLDDTMFDLMVKRSTR